MSKDNPTPQEELVIVLSGLVQALALETEDVLGKDNSLVITARAIQVKARREYLKDMGLPDNDETDWLFIPVDLIKNFRTAMRGVRESLEKMKGK